MCYIANKEKSDCPRKVNWLKSNFTEKHIEPILTIKFLI